MSTLEEVIRDADINHSLTKREIAVIAGTVKYWLLSETTIERSRQAVWSTFMFQPAVEFSDDNAEELARAALAAAIGETP